MSDVQHKRIEKKTPKGTAYLTQDRHWTHKRELAGSWPEAEALKIVRRLRGARVV